MSGSWGGLYRPLPACYISAHLQSLIIQEYTFNTLKATNKLRQLSLFLRRLHAVWNRRSVVV